jgi:hypothetical protein
MTGKGLAHVQPEATDGDHAGGTDRLRDLAHPSQRGISAVFGGAFKGVDVVLLTGHSSTVRTDPDGRITSGPHPLRRT